MTINWEQVRRIVLNDRLIGYKPDRASLDKLSDRLPDVRVLGFGIYSSVGIWKTWFLLVESKTFWPDHTDTIQTMPINQVGRSLTLMRSVSNKLSPKPSA